jgi:hypothetical protein
MMSGNEQKQSVSWVYETGSSETQQQSDDGTKHKGSQDEPFPNVET